MTELNVSAPAFPGAPRYPRLRWIVDYNPCFLLSAVCMLLGCRLLNDAVNSRAGDTHGSLWLILTINVYEFCLLGAAMLIHRWQGMRRDVSIVLIVAALFMGDLAFVIGDLSTAHPGVGLAIALVLTPLAAIKAWLAMRLIGAEQRQRIVAIVTTQVAIVLLLPVLLKAISIHHNGSLSPAVVYAGWWIAALFPIAWQLIVQSRTNQPLSKIAWTYVAISWLAMLGHLWACAWVFKLDTPVACLAPPLLGLATAISFARRFRGDPAAVLMQAVFVSLAVLCAGGAPNYLIGGTGGAWHAVTPYRLTLLAAFGVVIHAAVVHRSILLLMMAMAGGCLVVAGPILRLLGKLWDWAYQLVSELIDACIPRTQVGWGIWTIGAAFALLAIGTAVSFLMKPVTKREEGS